MNENGFKVLVVDDDITYAGICAKVIEAAGFTVTAAGSTTDALATLESDSPVGLVLTDLKMPDRDGMELLREVKRRHPAIEVIVMTGYGSIESAVAAIREKAFDYITKPFDKDELLNAVDRVHRVWQVQSEARRLHHTPEGHLHLPGYVFRNEAMARAYDRVRTAARCDCSVLITGESGTGKEVMARAIHSNSARANGPFVPVNCGALPSDLVESELFGHRKGAFTGANSDHSGLFQAANGGTLFLDEIAEMPFGTQSKLLRAIQDHTVRPVGSVDEARIDIRFIAAINLKVTAALSRKVLREDLFHRLNVITIELPPLRRMRDEIPHLLIFLLQSASRKRTHPIEGFEERALQHLTDYHWPGNIREADNLVERLTIALDTRTVAIHDLPRQISAATHRDESDTVPSLSESEKELVRRALRVTRGNKSQAAALLGISRPRLYKLIEQHDLRSS